MQDCVGATYPLEDILNNISPEEIEEEAHSYAKEVAREALRNASENADLIESIPNSALYDTIDKRTILNESNIPEL